MFELGQAISGLSTLTRRCFARSVDAIRVCGLLAGCWLCLVCRCVDLPLFATSHKRFRGSSAAQTSAEVFRTQLSSTNFCRGLWEETPQHKQPQKNQGGNSAALGRCSHVLPVWEECRNIFFGPDASTQEFLKTRRPLHVQSPLCLRD